MELMRLWAMFLSSALPLLIFTVTAGTLFDIQAPASILRNFEPLCIKPTD
jgi:hypothetical protein